MHGEKMGTLDEKLLLICQKIKFFKDISVTNIPKLVQHPKLIKYKAGEIILKEGDESKEFYYVVKGEVRVIKKIGGTNQNLATMREGRIFGEIATILEKPRNATIIANAENTTIFSFNFDKNLAKKFPEDYSIFITNLAEDLCMKVNELNVKLF